MIAGKSNSTPCKCKGAFWRCHIGYKKGVGVSQAKERQKTGNVEVSGRSGGRIS